MELKREEIEIFGEKAQARELSLGEFQKVLSYEAKMSDEIPALRALRVGVYVVSLALENGDGKAKYTVEQLEGVGQSQSKDINRAFETIWRLSGLSTAEEPVKNSEPAPSVSA